MTAFEKATYAKIIFSLDDVNDDDSFAYYHYDSRPDNRPIIVSDISEFKSWIVKLNPALKLFLVIHIGAESHEKKQAEKKGGKYIKYSCETFIEALKESFPNIQYVLASRDPKAEDKTYFNADIWNSDGVIDLNDSHPSQIIQEILPKDEIFPLTRPFKLRDNETIDFAIITALYYDELEEIRRAFGLTKVSQFEFGNNVGYAFEYNSFKMIAVSQAEMGMVDSAILTSEIMMRFTPKYIIMPGVCGGDTKTNFGDIVISKKIHFFQAGKLKNEGFSKESVEVKMDNSTIKKIQQGEKEIVAEIQEELKNTMDDAIQKFKPLSENKISIHFEPTACSTMVIDKKGYFEEIIKDIDRKMIAVEMEGYGVARATEYLLTNTKAVLIKCVMDKTELKDDIAKPYAAYVSAQFVKKLIEKNILL
jgi:nucleoside phosphorylase